MSGPGTVLLFTDPGAALIVLAVLTLLALVRAEQKERKRS
jgi:hypothetical protein